MSPRKDTPPKTPAPSKLDPSTLRLDTENPRFAAHLLGNRPKEHDVIVSLLEIADLRELIDSIAANGYIDYEPLIVIKEKQGLTVIEGNRRVAAIKLLRSPELAGELGVKLPSLSEELEQTLNLVNAITVEDRAAARQYIGFKHINGPHKWDSFAKGKFAADWYRAEHKSGLTVRDIAQRLGDRHDTVLRLVNGIFVLEQAERAGLFEIADRYGGGPFFFSHLYTAIARPQYRVYLGLEASWRQIEPEINPVPKSHLPQLKQLLKWLYGSDEDKQPSIVTSQNPHIKQLGEVLSTPIALKQLEATRDLVKAFAEVETRGRKFEESLIKAVKHAEDAQQYVDAYEPEETLQEYVIRLGKIAQSLQKSMKP